MGAAGVSGAAGTWMQREPFEEWLAAMTRPGGRDQQAGTVLVWRDAAGAVQHAAVTLGGDWALHKPSQGWMSPTKVLAVRDAILSARAAGHHLQRRTLVS
jgi:cell wall-associated NlpC family hydrolase